MNVAVAVEPALELPRDPCAAPEYKVATDLEREAGFSFSKYRSPWPEASDSSNELTRHQASLLTDGQWESMATVPAEVMDTDNDWAEGTTERLLRLVYEYAFQVKGLDLDNPKVKSRQIGLRSHGIVDSDGVTPLGRAVQRRRAVMDASAA